MNQKRHNPENVAAPVGNYSHGIEIAPGARYLFISGQVPERQNGEIPASFEEQCHVVWDGIFAALPLPSAVTDTCERPTATAAKMAARPAMLTFIELIRSAGPQPELEGTFQLY